MLGWTYKEITDVDKLSPLRWDGVMIEKKQLRLKKIFHIRTYTIFIKFLIRNQVWIGILSASSAVINSTQSKNGLRFLFLFIISPT